MSKATMTARQIRSAHNINLASLTIDPQTQRNIDTLKQSQLRLYEDPEQPTYVTRHLSIAASTLEALLSDSTRAYYLPVYEVVQRSGISKHANWRIMYRTFQNNKAHTVAKWYRSRESHLEVQVKVKHLKITGDIC